MKSSICKVAFFISIALHISLFPVHAQTEILLPERLGDLDNDGKPTVTDVVKVLHEVSGFDPLPVELIPFADVNQDGLIDNQDSNYIVAAILGLKELPLALTSILSTSPANGEDGVANTRETIIRFNAPLAEDAEITSDKLFAAFGGEKIPARIHIAPNRMSVTLFYNIENNLLPPSARVRVTFIGDDILDARGKFLDADGDGLPGGTAIIDFDTLTLTIIEGTAVCGRVFDSELMLSEGGSMMVNPPLQGVVVTVDGMEDELFAVTDEEGNFRLEPAPAGSFYVHIDGRKVLTASQGTYYPFVGKSWKSVPGEEINIGEIYLPLIDDGTLQNVSQDQETVIKAAESVRQENTAFENVEIRVPAGSLTNDDGSSGLMVGIAPVDPDRLPGALPDELQFPVVITVQTDGATNFDSPVSVIFPNLPDKDGNVLAAGAKTALWSFNHDTGRFEVVGPMTVSADGLTIVSDPGVGILAPGWHGTNPGSTGGGGDMGGGGGPDGDMEPGGKDDPGGGPGGDNGNDSGGQSCEDDGSSKDGGTDGDPIYLFSGEFYTTDIDFLIKGRGLNFVWERKYRSKIGPNTVQGNGWDYSYNIFIEQQEGNILVCDGNSRADIYQPLQVGKRWVRREFFRELVKNNDGSYTMEFPDKGKWHFRPFDGSPAQGKITAIVDRNGNQISLSYNDLGQLITVTDTLNRPIEIGYNADNFIETVTDFTGRVVRYDYYNDSDEGGSSGDLKSVTSPVVTATPNGNDFPNGKTVTYTYSKGFVNERLNHNLLTITDGRRNDPNDATFGDNPFVINIYDNTSNPEEVNFDRVVRQIWGGGTFDLVYDPQLPSEHNNELVIKTIVNDRVGNVAEYFFDRRNRLIRRRDFTGRANATQPTTATTNRPTGKLRKTDPDFFETVIEWNEDSQRTRVIHPNGNITENIYESDINTEASARSKGNLRIIRRLPGSHTPVGDQEVIEESFAYDTDFNGCCGFNFVTRHADGRGNETLHQYDAQGNRIHTQHRIVSISEDYEYNQFGQLTAHVWPDNGSNHRRRDEFAYYESGHQRGYPQKKIEDAGNFNLTTIYDYDEVGNAISEIDPRGHDTQFVFNQLDQVVREISREVLGGTNIRYEKDYFYDANNNRIQIDIQNKDDQGVFQQNTHFTTTYEYEILNYLIKESKEVTSEHFIVTEYEYDANRNRTLTRYGEATNGNQPTNIVRTLYDERDLVYQVIRADGDSDQSTTQINYDRNRNQVTRLEGIEVIPHIYNSVFDSYDRLVQMINPMGDVTDFQYDANHNRVHSLVLGELEDIEGNANNIRLRETTYVYDEMDRLTKEEKEFFDTKTQQLIDDGKSIAQTFYSDNSQIIKVINDNKHETLISYDADNRLSVILDAKGNTKTYAYDNNSNVVSLTEVDKSDLGNADQTFNTQQQYDNLDRLTSVIDNVGNKKQYSFDSRNNQTLEMDALKNQTIYAYDGVNRLIETNRLLTEDGTGSTAVVESATITTKQEWDDTSRLITQIDDNNNRTTYGYDPLNRKISTTYADKTITTYRFDVHDNEISMQDANGNVVNSQFDLLDRVTRKNITPGNDVSNQTTFEILKYDGLSRLIHGEDDDSLFTLSYDSLSRVSRETLNGQTTLCLYDGVGNEVLCTYPGGRIITCTFDELERKKQISDQNGLVAEYFYVGPNRVERREYGNDTQTDYTYDGITNFANPVNDFGVKRIVQTKHYKISDGTVIDDRTYTWDKSYNKTQRRDIRTSGPQLTHDYTYDSVYRMIRSEKSSPSLTMDITDYTLDGVGNRNKVTGGSNPGNYTLENNLPETGDFQLNQYTTTPSDSRQHDLNGNLVSSTKAGQTSERTYAYDYRNQMVTSNNTESGTVATYAYDVLGRRITRKVTGSDPVHDLYFYSDWQVCEEQNANNETLATYVYGLYIDEVLNMQRGKNDYYYHTDDLYNVMTISDATGSVMERYEYSDFGEPLIFDAAEARIQRTAIHNPYLFTGRRYDNETGFYYYRTRYMEPIIGKFTIRDTIGIWGDYFNSGNGYLIINNNIHSLLDPYGLIAYRCRRPFRIGPFDLPDPFYHEYICVQIGLGPPICFGQTPNPTRIWPWGPGVPSNDSFDPDLCKPIDPDGNDCIDRCLLEGPSDQRPDYGPFGPGSNCQEFADDKLNECRRRCSSP